MNAEELLVRAREIYSQALEEWERAEREQHPLLLRDSCGKGWLAALEATRAFLLKKGLTAETLPSTDRGWRYMLFKYADKEMRVLYSSLRESLHLAGYYEGILTFEEVKERLRDLGEYIQYIQKVVEGKCRNW